MLKRGSQVREENVCPQQSLAVQFKLISFHQLPALKPSPAREEDCYSKVDVCPRFGQGRVNFLQ